MSDACGSAATNACCMARKLSVLLTARPSALYESSTTVIRAELFPPAALTRVAISPRLLLYSVSLDVFPRSASPCIHTKHASGELLAAFAPLTALMSLVVRLSLADGFQSASTKREDPPLATFTTYLGSPVATEQY